LHDRESKLVKQAGMEDQTFIFLAGVMISQISALDQGDKIKIILYLP
jgi:hypothetical protein